MATRTRASARPVSILTVGLLAGVLVFGLLVVVASGTRTTMVVGLPVATVLGVGTAVATVLYLRDRHW
ncbi:hypothetical protein [Haloarchaeobius sp. DT45]|uniref:hypothetical protein n=1 Tax=Haloarchaeobius sp. DT45 TaxID=3446116 RepID=UPI003F6B63E5